MPFTICGDNFRNFNAPRKKLFLIEIQGFVSLFKSYQSPGEIHISVPYFGRKIERPEPNASIWSGDLVIDEEWKNRDLLERLACEKATFDMKVKTFNKIGEQTGDDQTFTGVRIEYISPVDNDTLNECQVEFKLVLTK